MDANILGIRSPNITLSVNGVQSRSRPVSLLKNMCSVSPGVTWYLPMQRQYTKGAGQEGQHHDINEYRLAPGGGGFVPVSVERIICRLSFFIHETALITQEFRRYVKVIDLFIKFPCKRVDLFPAELVGVHHA